MRSLILKKIRLLYYINSLLKTYYKIKKTL